MDRKFNYKKLMMGMRKILSGALFIATNLDKTFPSSDGLIPGAGSIVAAMEACVNRKPDIVIGKPSKIMFELALKNVNRKRTLVVGDRLDTDVVVARKLKIRSILLLTGVSTLRDVRRAHRMGESPDFVYESLAEVVS